MCYIKSANFEISFLFVFLEKKSTSREKIESSETDILRLKV